MAVTGDLAAGKAGRRERGGVGSEVTNMVDEAGAGGAGLRVEDVLGVVAGELGGVVVENGEDLDGLIEGGAVKSQWDLVRSWEWVYTKCPQYSARFRGETFGCGWDVVVFMAQGFVVFIAQGFVVQGLQGVEEGDEDVELGYVSEKGSLGDGDG